MAHARPASLRYFTIVESSPVAMVMVGGDGVIQFNNTETERMFGYRHGELLGQSIDVLVPAHLRKRHADFRKGFLRSPSKRPMGAGRDLMGLRRDGSEFPVEVGLTPIQARAGLLVLATIIDITDRKKTEDETQRHIAELEAAVMGAVDGVVVIDESGIIEWLNPAVGRLFGYERDELIGQDVRLLIPEPYQSEHDSLRDYDSAGEAKIVGIGRAVEGRRKDGSVFPIDMAVGAVPMAGKRLLAGFIHDLSERRKLETRLDQLREDRLKVMGEMAAALAHEINQPLAATGAYIGTAERLLKMAPAQRPTKVEEVLDFARQQVMQAGRIIQNVREFADRAEPNKTHEHLHELIHEVAEFILGKVKQAGAALLLDLDAPEDRVIVDKIQIKQALVNLVQNAIEAVSGGGVREIRISTRLAGSNEITVDIEDTGPGILEDMKAKLFEPFVGTKIKGMGVGLSIARSIIESHYGKISIDANPAGGATAAFTLPLAESWGQGS